MHRQILRKHKIATCKTTMKEEIIHITLTFNRINTIDVYFRFVLILNKN